MGRILIGTCSWTDKTLIECGRFYPSWARVPEGRLRFYASHFPVVEVDSSFYALPTRHNSQLWVERTPDDFVFHVKAFALFTGHSAEVRSLGRDLQDAIRQQPSAKGRVYMNQLPEEIQQETWRRFSEALLPLKDAGKLGLVLFQFPPWFHPGEKSLEYILRCKEKLPEYGLAMEFRNGAWFKGASRGHILQFLEDNGLTFVCVDEPQGFQSSVPPVAVATTELAYVRFHGRNLNTWEKKGATVSERFNYYYSEEELQEWLPPLRALQGVTRATNVLFNTNYQDQGVVNAQKLSGLLGEGAL